MIFRMGEYSVRPRSDFLNSLVQMRGGDSLISLFCRIGVKWVITKDGKVLMPAYKNYADAVKLAKVQLVEGLNYPILWGLDDIADMYSAVKANGMYDYKMTNDEDHGGSMGYFTWTTISESEGVVEHMIEFITSLSKAPR